MLRLFTIPLLLLLLFSQGCTKSEIVLSELSISDITKERSSTSETTFSFNINIYPKSIETITVEYYTVDGSAIDGKDYIGEKGTLTINPNQSGAIIDITVLKDSLRNADQEFSVVLKSATNATISIKGTAIGTIQNPGTYLPVNGSGYEASTSYQNMNLVWSDEFSDKTLNTSNWTAETGGSGWGNNELQYYTNSTKNSFLSNGFLIIEARKELYNTNSYTSARIISKDKKSFTYGRVDIRAKLPKGQGIWPALWMLGTNISTLSWPACGEIDIMELLGHEPNKTYGTAHWGNVGSASTHIGDNYTLANGNFNDNFHVFSLQWDAIQMTFLVDDMSYFTLTKTQVNGNYPFDKPFFFIMNVAVGGNWPGNPNSTTEFPQRMVVDYVRVYQLIN